MTFSLKGLKTITNYQYEPACGILSLLDILILNWEQLKFELFKVDRGTSDQLKRPLSDRSLL